LKKEDIKGVEEEEEEEGRRVHENRQKVDGELDEYD